MATVGDSLDLLKKFNNLEIKIEPDKQEMVDEGNLQEYGLPLPEVYKLALSFYKGIQLTSHSLANYLYKILEKEGKAVHFSYEDKLSLVAFSQQVLHGPISEAVAKLPPLGALDVVGRDRRLAWQKLGILDANQARAGFVELLSRRCPLFTAYIEAHRMEKREQERLA